HRADLCLRVAFADNQTTRMHDYRLGAGHSDIDQVQRFTQDNPFGYVNEQAVAQKCGVECDESCAVLLNILDEVWLNQVADISPGRSQTAHMDTRGKVSNM